MRTAAATILLALAIPSLAIPPVPRPTKEFTFVDPAGKESLLTSLKGKVVIVQFLYTWCPHCQAFSGILNKLQRELGPVGIEARGVAFDDDVDAAKTAQYKQKYAQGFPIAFAKRDQVLSYLGISVMERFSVPMIVIIDKQGRIRAQSQPQGTAELQEEANLRKWLTALAAEKPSAPATALLPASATSAK